MYADYAYYTETYCGTLVKENQWPSASRAADAYLDLVTFGRLRLGWPVDDDVRMAACAVAEAASRYQAAQAERKPGLAGFTNDGYSESYSGTTAELTNQQQTEMGAAVDLYLPRSHPLRYAGGDPPCWVATRP